MPPELETWVILGGPVIAFLALFFLPLVSNKGHRAPSKRPWAVGTVIAGFVGFVVLTIYGYREPWSPDFDVEPLPLNVIVQPLPESIRGTAHEQTIVRGGALVHKKGCLYCHYIDTQGGHRGPELTYIGDRLTREDLIIRINNGGHNMPSFAASMNADELVHIVDFLQSRREFATDKTTNHVNDTNE